MQAFKLTILPQNIIDYTHTGHLFDATPLVGCGSVKNLLSGLVHAQKKQKGRVVEGGGGP